MQSHKTLVRIRKIYISISKIISNHMQYTTLLNEVLHHIQLRAVIDELFAYDSENIKPSKRGIVETLKRLMFPSYSCPQSTFNLMNDDK